LGYLLEVLDGGGELTGTALTLGGQLGRIVQALETGGSGREHRNDRKESIISNSKE
jgi:hypothetical protein